MAATELLLSVIAVIVALYLGIKIVKNIIVTAIMIAVLAGIL